MKQFFSCLVFFLLLAMPALCQDRLVSGVLKADDGSPLPGVNVVVKGTAHGTASDASGRYVIRAPLGATLVFSFIGYASSEVVVTVRNSSPVGGKAAPAVAARQMHPAAPLQDTVINRRGVASLANPSPGFVQKSARSQPGMPVPEMMHPGVPEAYSIRFVPRGWAKLWYGRAGENGLFVVRDRQPTVRPFRVTFSSSFTLDQVNRLPARQNGFAQGRPLAGASVWRGPATGEGFSWGPALGSLEYTGAPDDFDRRGPLTTAGNGNGNPAAAHSPYAFFRTGTAADQALAVSRQGGETRVSVGVGRKDQQHVIPGSALYRNNLSARLGTRLFHALRLDYALALSETGGTLLPRGGNLACIVSSVMRTPPSFDNAGGFTPKEAARNAGAWLLPGGGPRSYSPGHADNPYGLASSLPDAEKLGHFVSGLTLRYSRNDLSLGYTGSLEKQRSRSFSGLPAPAAGYPGGRFTRRTETAGTFRSGFSAAWKKWFAGSEFDAGLGYDFSHGRREVHRQDGFGFAAGEPLAAAGADSVAARGAFRTRQVHELRASAGFNYHRFLYLSLANRGYFSSTVDRAFGLLPGAGLAFNVTEIYPFSDQRVVTTGKLRASYAKTVREAPLLYTDWHYASTVLPVAGYAGYYEAGELPFVPGLRPEVLHKFEAGTEIALWYRVTLEFNHFRHLTRGALFPVPGPADFTLVNGADIANRGFDGSLRYTHHGNALKWEVGVSWSRVNPVVQRLYGGRERIPLAGFAEVSTNLAEGRPVGVLYGSTFARNAGGERLVGPDGFPLVGAELRPVGNPNPDWTGGLTGSLSWRTLDLAWAVDVRKGGDIWNGTGQVLNYYGVSRETGERRAVRDYVFGGVKPHGSPNDVPVAFADPAAGLAGNRWVRYGLTGVAEEAVRDGSWARLNEVKLSYDCTRLLRSLLPGSDMRLSLVGKNLLLLTRYPGVDPSAALYGYAWGAGLDLFNTPNTRSYGASLTIKL